MVQIIQDILSIFSNTNRPYTTTEIVKLLKKPRHIIKNRLDKLAIEGKIKGKQTKNRGSWIWWVPMQNLSEIIGINNELKKLNTQVQKLEKEKLELQTQSRKRVSKKLTESPKNKELVDKLRHEVNELKSDIDLFIEFINSIVESTYKDRRFESEEDKYDYFRDDKGFSSYLIKKYFIE